MKLNDQREKNIKSPWRGAKETVAIILVIENCILDKWA